MDTSKRVAKDSRYLASSESESERSDVDDREQLFRKVIDDYTTWDSAFAKSFIKAMPQFRQYNIYKRFAIIYRTFEDGYIQKAEKTDSKSKEREYLARVIFCQVAHTTLRNSNSSSILERSFSDAIRSCSDRKTSKRNVFSIKIFYLNF